MCSVQIIEMSIIYQRNTKYKATTSDVLFVSTKERQSFPTRTFIVQDSFIHRAKWYAQLALKYADIFFNKCNGPA